MSPYDSRASCPTECTAGAPGNTNNELLSNEKYFVWFPKAQFAEEARVVRPVTLKNPSEAPASGIKQSMQLHPIQQPIRPGVYRNAPLGHAESGAHLVIDMNLGRFAGLLPF